MTLIICPIHGTEMDRETRTVNGVEIIRYICPEGSFVTRWISSNPDAVYVAEGETDIRALLNEMFGNLNLGPNAQVYHGDGINTIFTLNHPFNSLAVVVQVRAATGGGVVYPDVEIIDANTIRLTYAEPPMPNEYYAVISV